MKIDTSNLTPKHIGKGRRGFTLIELIVATTILIILTGMAVPLVRVTVQREQERQLRIALWSMRDAIDLYKAAADRGAFQTKLGSEGYPPDLDTLAKGVDAGGKKLRFLRRIPIDPMTGKAEWGTRSMQDDPDSDSGGSRMFLTSIRSRRPQLWMARNTRIGRHTEMSLTLMSARADYIVSRIYPRVLEE